MKIHLRQTHHTIGDFSAILTTIKETFESGEAGIHVFPELFLTGYPLQDLCLEKNFITAYQKLLADIKDLVSTIYRKDLVCLIGGLDYEFQEDGLPKKIRNSIFEVKSNEPMRSLYSKQLLPNYDIFDEGKYFTAGKDICIWEWENKKFALLICEDMWPSSLHHTDPAKDIETKLQSENIKIDGVINLSASPFRRGMTANRRERAKDISLALEAPFYYVNRVGGEDEILFDGDSFVVNGTTTLANSKRFEADTLSYEVPSFNDSRIPFPKDYIKSSWESLFLPQFDQSQPPKIRELTDDECEELLQAIGFGVQEYASKTWHKNFTVALSGGIDSSLVLAILKIFLRPGQSLEAVFMPSKFTSGLSDELAQEQCRVMEVPLYTFSIVNVHETIRKDYQSAFSSTLEGLGDENVQARIRASLLFARSNSMNSLVINTSNKSELGVGYSTLYGDSVGALSIIGDLYKTEVFKLCEYINKKYPNYIPKGVIERPPSAELRPDQEDSQSLPPYERLDAILEGMVSCRHTNAELIKLGFTESEVEKTFKLYTRAEYKRNQFAPIVKLKPKSFGFGHRVPICKILK